MKNLKKKKLTISILFIIILSSITLTLDGNNLINSISDKGNFVTKKSSVINSIYINDLGVNNWENAVSEGICTGSGIKDDPYIIENIILGEMINPDGNTIVQIENSEAYFTIRNIEIYSGEVAMKLINVKNSIIIHSIIKSENKAIIIENSYNNNISLNRIIGNNFGISIEDSIDNVISKNFIEISKNYDPYMSSYGISLTRCNFNNITDNYIEGKCQYGINALYSDNLILSFNRISNIEIGINLANSNSIDIKYNYITCESRTNDEFDEDIICIRGEMCNDVNILNNILNRSYYGISFGENLASAKNIEISENYIGYTYYNSFSSSYTLAIEGNLEDSKIIGNIFENTYADHLLDDYSKFTNVIKNANSIYGAYFDIHIDDEGIEGLTWSEASKYNWCSGEGTKRNPYEINGLRISNNYRKNGILIENSEVYFNIINCEFLKTIDSGSWEYSAIRLNNVKYGRILNNIIKDNNINGIIIEGDSGYNNINGNNLYHNKGVGIIIRDNSNSNPNCGYNSIVKNNIIARYYDCLEIESNNNSISENYFDSGGVDLSGLSNNNKLFKNIFYNVNFKDNGVNNNLYYQNIGNLWSDYSGKDINDDSMGDVPHYIQDKQDPFPIWNDGKEGVIDEIQIDDSNIFTYNWIFAKSQDKCTGSGTKTDPYVISFEKSTKYSIKIQNSESYFSIQNTEFEKSERNYAIKLKNVRNGMIWRNKFDNYLKSIILNSSYYNIIDENEFNYRYLGNIDIKAIGISLFKSRYNNISNLEIKKDVYEEGAFHGILFHSSNYNKISNGIIKSHYNGILFYNSSYNTITDIRFQCEYNDIYIFYKSNYNHIYNNYLNFQIKKMAENPITFYMRNCNNNLIENNIFVESYNTYSQTGSITLFSLENTMNNTIKSNEIRIAFKYENQEPNENYYGIKLNSCKNTDIIDNLISYETYNIKKEDHSFGIYLENCEDIDILDNTISSWKYGIKAVNCTTNNVANNIFSNNWIYGLQIKFGDSNVVEKNKIENNNNGIFLTERNSIIRENSINNNNGNGIIIESDSNEVTHNIINGNKKHGIYITGSYLNINHNYISYNQLNGINNLGNSNLIEKNKIHNNLGHGIAVYNYSNNIFKNIVRDNEEYGVYLLITSFGNLVSENVLYHNLGKSRPPPKDDYYDGVDDGSNNHWNTSEVGNYWGSTYGEDKDGDGISDFPVFFPGNIDYLPLYSFSGYDLDYGWVNPSNIKVGRIITISCILINDWGVKDVIASIKNDKNIIIASINLFDDGKHKDDSSGDLVYANQLSKNLITEEGDYKIDIIIKDFTNVEKIYLNAISFDLYIPRSLLLVHGWNGNIGQFDNIRNDLEIKNTYINIDRVEYNNRNFMGVDVSMFSPSIRELSGLMAEYLMKNIDKFEGKLDIVCHSMGGLIIRAMIKYYYHIIQSFFEQKGLIFEIDHVATIATPNYGASICAILLVIFPIPILFLAGDQVNDMVPGSSFLKNLNKNNDAPYNDEIDWFTYGGGRDVVVFSSYVPLDNAKLNRKYSKLHHHNIVKDSEVIYDLKIDLEVDIIKIPSPMVSNPPDINSEIDEIGNNIIWILNDEDPNTYTVYKNNIVMEEGVWQSNSPIIVSLDGLNGGTYEFKIIVYDQLLHKTEDIVQVIIKNVYQDGDVNHDGIITNTDANLIAQYYIGFNPNPFFPEQADVNHDGQITIVDAQIVAQMSSN
ncbi:MAG: right-handed parallel beta-helix repeat-containing protein [Candidatus Lokiarchaeota archaeon]|nr:right-handed parallel beta-helix repeat-containing protein [Candidatus Lokiarchaeota archaeon]